MTLPVGSLAAYLSVRGAAQARQEILSVQQGLTGAGEAASAAGGALGRTEAGLAATGRGSAVASSGANKLRAAQLGVVAATERWNAVLADENATIAQTATAQRGLILANERVTATTRTMAAAQAKATETTAAAATATRESTVATSRFADATGGTVRQLGVMLGGFALLKGAISIEKQSVEFQRQMLLIQTQAGASAAEVQDMTKAVLEMAGPLATSPMELAKSLYLVESAGYRSSDALMIETAAAKEAKVGHADLIQTTDALVGVLQTNLTGGAKHATETVATLNAIVGAGKMHMDDLNAAIGTGFLATAKSFGISIQSAGAALALMTDQGTPADSAATHLRMTMSLLAAPTEKASKLLEDVGVSSADAGVQVSAMQQVLEKAGVKSLQLAADLKKPNGFLVALSDLKSHMKSAGLTAAESAALLSRAFGGGRSSGPILQMVANLDLLKTKYGQIIDSQSAFGKDWTETTKTAAFAWKQFTVEADAAALGIANGALPVVTGLGHVLALALPAALGTAKAALIPFAAGWNVLSDVLPPIGHALADVGGFLSPLAPVLQGVAGATLAMWAAFKGYQIARAAISGVIDIVGALYAKTGSALAGITGAFATSGTAANAAAMQVLAAQTAQTAAVDAAAATVARAEVAKAAAASLAASEVGAAEAAEADAAVTSAREFALAAESKAAASRAVAASTTASAEKTAAAAATEAAAARTGWAAMLGPLALVGVGVGVLVSMFHHSATASKEATDAAKAYTDALTVDSNTGGSGTVDAITKQLSDNNVPQKIDALNKALGSVQFHGKEFTSALNSAAKGADGPLRNLEARLYAVTRATTFQTGAKGDLGTFVKQLTPQAKAAAELLRDLSDQYTGMTAAQAKEISTFKQFGTVAAPVAQIAQTLHLGTGALVQYAGMLGLAVTKNNDLVDATKQNQAALKTLGDDYDHATASGSAYLDALKTFSGSAKTAADRAALIGATLKAANGDALGFASAMIGANAANRALTDGFAGDADKIAGLKQQIADLYTAANKTPAGDSGVASATMTATSVAISNTESRIAELNAKIASGKLSASGLAAAHRSLATAQASLGVATARLSSEQGKLSKAQGGGAVDARQLLALQKQLAAAYANSEKAAIQLSTGKIDFKKAGAPALVGQLQAIQDAAMKAASATFQHEVATVGATKAADDAYNLYKNQTQGALENERKQLGLNKDQVDKFAKIYFGLDGTKVKPMIEAAGTDQTLNVLKDIDKMLTFLATGKWSIKVDADTVALDAKLKALADLEKTFPGGSNQAAGINRTRAILEGRAAGGPVMAGVPYLVGEKRAEIFVPNVSGRIEPRVPMGHKTINIYQTFNNPLPETGSGSGQVGLRRAVARLDGL